MSVPSIALPDATQQGVKTNNPSQEDIANLAYQIWQQRGASAGTPEQDWTEAEEKLCRPCRGVTYPARP